MWRDQGLTEHRPVTLSAVHELKGSGLIPYPQKVKSKAREEGRCLQLTGPAMKVASSNVCEVSGTHSARGLLLVPVRFQSRFLWP